MGRDEDGGLHEAEYTVQVRLWLRGTDNSKETRSFALENSSIIVEI